MALVTRSMFLLKRVARYGHVLWLINSLLRTHVQHLSRYVVVE
jgi:hypothetical protein